jgi:hypothetical protein
LDGKKLEIVALHLGSDDSVRALRDCITDLRYSRAVSARESDESLQRTLRPLFEARVTFRKNRVESPGADVAGRALLAQHPDMKEAFFEIAERAVSSIDEYGEEKWPAYERELRRFGAKLAQKAHTSARGLSDILDLDQRDPASIVRACRAAYRHGPRLLALGAAVRAADEEFRGRHAKRPVRATNYSGLDGIEFENLVAKLFSDAGFRVRGTPATNDQGADIIARKAGYQVVVQAKRYSGSVGNAAVQEVIAAREYYTADEAWVVTSSTFTSSARDLANRSRVSLFDGEALRTFPAYLEAWPGNMDRDSGANRG